MYTSYALICSFGSVKMSQKTGIIFNNQMDDFRQSHLLSQSEFIENSATFCICYIYEKVNCHQNSITRSTLLGSGSEWPKDQVLLLTMVSYKKENKEKLKYKKEKRKKILRAVLECLSKWIKVDKWDYFQNGSFIFLNIKPLSEVAPGLLVIQIQIQAVWNDLCIMTLLRALIWQLFPFLPSN